MKQITVLPATLMLAACQTVYSPPPEKHPLLFSELPECAKLADQYDMKPGQFGEDIRAVTYRTALPDGGYCRGETAEKGRFWYFPLTKVAFYLGAYQVGETWGQKHITPAIFEMQPLVHFSNLPTKGTEDRLSYRTRRLYSALADSMKAGHLDGEFEIDKQREWPVAEHYFGKGQSAYYDPGYRSIFSLIGINDLAPRSGTYEGELKRSVWLPAFVECPVYRLRFTLSHDAAEDVGRLTLKDIEVYGIHDRWEKAEGFYPEPDEGAIFPHYDFTQLRSNAFHKPISISMGFNHTGKFTGEYHEPGSSCKGNFTLVKTEN